MGCAESTASTPAQPPATNTPNDSNKPKPDQKMNTSASQANVLNKNKEETNKLTSSSSNINKSKSPSKNESNLRGSTKSLTK